MKLTDVRRLGWDTETTGPDPTTDRIVTAAVIIRGGTLPDRTSTWLINPGIDIPTGASDIHGITTAKAQADGQDPKTALEEIATLLAAALSWRSPVVAFNTSFDWTILHHDLARNGLPTMYDRLDGDPLTLIDPHVIDKQADRYVSGSKQRKLQPTATRYGIEITNWHTADADADAALRVAEVQFDRYQHLQDRTPEELFAAQQRWRREQQDSLRDWFTSQGHDDKAATVQSHWPLIPAAAEGGEG